jgi:hypothetical protein
MVTSADVVVATSPCSSVGGGGASADMDHPSPRSAGVTDLSYDSGAVIPAGYSLRASGNHMSAPVSAFGYTLPAADTPAGR